jgi:hypothetical protein
MPYKYVAMWNLPGCLPEMEPAEFDNAVLAFEWMADELDRGAFNSQDDTEHDEFEIAGDECRAKASAGVIGEDEWSWPGPDGYVYSITCEDIPDE